MSPTILKIAYSKLRRDEIRTFNSRVLQILDNAGCDAGAKHKAFRAAAEVYENVLHGQGFTSSVSLAEYDRLADDAWLGLSLQIRASLMHPEAAVREAAQKVDVVFQKTENPTRLSYDLEYGALATLVSQLKSLDDEVLEASLVKPYLTHLDSCVQNFMNAAASVVDTKAQKEIGAAKSAADVCYQAWLDLAKFLEVAADSGLVDHAEDAIVRLNVMNAEIKSRMNVRSVQKDKGVFEDIAAPEA